MPGQHQHGPWHRVGGHRRARPGEHLRVGDGGQPPGGSPGQGGQQQHRRGHQRGRGRPAPPGRQRRHQPLHPQSEGHRLDQGQGGDELLGVADEPPAGDVHHHQVDQGPQPGHGVGGRQDQPEPGRHQQADAGTRRQPPPQQRQSGHDHRQDHHEPAQPRPGPDPGRHGQRVPDPTQPDQAPHRPQRPVGSRRERRRPLGSHGHPSRPQHTRHQPGRVHHQGDPDDHPDPGGLRRRPSVRGPPERSLRRRRPLRGPPEGERSRTREGRRLAVHSPPPAARPRWGGGDLPPAAGRGRGGDHADCDPGGDEPTRGASRRGDGQGQDQAANRPSDAYPQIHACPGHEGKGGVGDQEAPVAHDQALVDEGAPGVEGGRGGRGGGAGRRGEPGGAGAGGDDDAEEDELLDQVGGDQAGGQGDQQVAGDRPGHGGVEAE
jgi:hypothetical protein